MAPDLTKEEQVNVRVALKFLRHRFGRWTPLAAALRMGESTLGDAASGRRPMTVMMAFRIARLAKVGFEDVVGGRYPEPGMCPMCGHRTDDPNIGGTK